MLLHGGEEHRQRRLSRVQLRALFGEHGYHPSGVCSGLVVVVPFTALVLIPLRSSSAVSHDDAELQPAG